jgi:hypothetical protein
MTDDEFRVQLRSVLLGRQARMLRDYLRRRGFEESITKCAFLVKNNNFDLQKAADASVARHLATAHQSFISRLFKWWTQS